MLLMMRPSLIFSAWQSIVSTVAPSRMTVIESATFASSLSLCEMMIEVMPCALNSMSSLQQRVAVGFVEAGGRLVEDQQLHLLGERLGDLDQLLLADAEIGDQRVRRFLQADLGQQLARAVERLAPVDDAHSGRLVAEKDVLGDRQQRHQRQFLVDDDDAEMLAVGDARKAALLALVDDLRLRRSRRDRRRSAPSSASTCRRRSRRRSRGSRLRATTRLTSRSALTPGKLLVIPRISRMAFIAMLVAYVRRLVARPCDVERLRRPRKSPAPNSARRPYCVGLRIT